MVPTWAGRDDLGVVGTAHHHWHQVGGKSPVELLSGVVLAQAVLEGEVELVLLFNLLKTLVPFHCTLEWLATPAKYIDWDILL